jgi:hypothetical protein
MGQASICIGHEGGRPLISGQNVPDTRRGMIKGIIKRQAGISGNAKNDLNPVRQKHFYYDLSAYH